MIGSFIGFALETLAIWIMLFVFVYLMWKVFGPRPDRYVPQPLLRPTEDAMREILTTTIRNCDYLRPHFDYLLASVRLDDFSGLPAHIAVDLLGRRIVIAIQQIPNRAEVETEWHAEMRLLSEANDRERRAKERAT